MRDENYHQAIRLGDLYEELAATIQFAVDVRQMYTNPIMHAEAEKIMLEYLAELSAEYGAANCLFILSVIRDDFGI